MKRRSECYKAFSKAKLDGRYRYCRSRMRDAMIEEAKGRGMSLKNLLQCVGMSRHYFAPMNMERGTTVEALFVVAEVTGKSPEWLIGGLDG